MASNDAIVLQRKGYKLSADGRDDGHTVWTAERDGARFAGNSPPELLGIVVLGEELGDEWNQQSPDVRRSPSNGQA